MNKRTFTIKIEENGSSVTVILSEHEAERIEALLNALRGRMSAASPATERAREKFLDDYLDGQGDVDAIFEYIFIAGYNEGLVNAVNPTIQEDLRELLLK